MMILKGRYSKWYEKASYEDFDAKEMIHNSFPIFDIEEEVRCNYVFQNLLGEKMNKMSFDEILSECKPFFDYVAENHSILADVYDKDLDNLTGMSTKQKALIVLNEKNEYLGHIYHYYTQTREHRIFGSDEKYYTNEAVMIDGVSRASSTHAAIKTAVLSVYDHLYLTLEES